MTKDTGMLFTPRTSARSQDRHHMRLNTEDGNKIERGHWSAEVTDQLTGKRYKVKGAACSLPRCFCDAVVVKELVCEVAS